MSLNIFIREKNDDLSNYKIVRDVEANFSKVILGEHEEDERILLQIEKAAVAGRNAFIDRFGFKLDSGFLSTGCKAALDDDVMTLVKELRNEDENTLVREDYDGNDGWIPDGIARFLGEEDQKQKIEKADSK